MFCLAEDIRWVQLNDRTFYDAVYVDGYDKRAQYIALQFPAKNNFITFWTMAFEKSDAIIMLDLEGPRHFEVYRCGRVKNMRISL